MRALAACGIGIIGIVAKTVTFRVLGGHRISGESVKFARGSEFLYLECPRRKKVRETSDSTRRERSGLYN